MFDNLLGGYGFRVLVAGIVVIGLIVLFAWLLRRFGGERLGGGTTRGRQPRLAVIDAATIDGRRRLVLIRRDNVEHLLIIGGPTDVVVEQNIVRAAAAQPQARPPAATETLPRAVPLGEDTMWPLQPEPAAPRLEPAPRPEPAPRHELRGEPRAEPAPRLDVGPRLDPPPRPQRQAPPPMGEEQMQWPADPEPLPAPPPVRERRPRPVDPLAGLAEELSRTPPFAEPDHVEPSPRPLLRREQRPPRPQPPAPPPVAAPPAAEAPFSSAADQNLAEMAQRLEAALRRPAKDDARPAPPPPATSAPEPDEVAEFTPQPPPPPLAPPAPRAPAPTEAARPPRSEPRPPRPDAAKPAAPQKSLYDSLEQEMASLLGRPNGKT
jgi:flagellar protein FliO/FliZ